MDALHQAPMARPPQTEAEYRREMNDRMRRMETRLTRFMEWMGFDTEVRRPEFDPQRGRIDIPTDAISLRDCLAVVPAHHRNPILVLHKGVIIATMTRQ